MRYIDFFDRGVLNYPDRPLIVDPMGATSFIEIKRKVDKVAARLLSLGVKPGDRIATYSPNKSGVFISKYAAIRAGAIWVPMNYRYTVEQIIQHMNAFDVETLFIDDSFAELAARIGSECPGLKHLIFFNEKKGGCASMAEWTADADCTQNFPDRLSSDPVLMLTTSGTTGQPKGVMLSNRSISTMIASHQICMPFYEPPVHLVAAPLSHAAGVFASSLLSIGGSNVILPDPSPLTIMEGIERHRANVLFLPPTLIYMMLAHPDVRRFDYSSLRYILYGAAPMSVEKLREAISVFGPVLAQGYGQSEVPNTISYFSPRDHVEALEQPELNHRIASAGRPGPLCQVAIMDDGGNLLPNGERGEIVCRGDLLMNGYYKNEAETALVSQFGWHHTGDIGVKDEDGFLYIVDRKKDLIISGGFNVFPAEVEQAILAHPAVQDCAVVGTPSEKWGEAVHAAVQLKDGAAATVDEIITFCRDKLGGIKTPKSVDFWAELPRSPVGKTLRRSVRQKYWEGHNRAI